MPTTQLLDYRSGLKTRQHGGHTEVWDPLRKKYVRLEPEELVRQLLIQAMIAECHVGAGRISIERTLGPTGRYDLTVYDREGRRRLLAECKSFRHRLSEVDMLQLARYNTVLKAPLLLLTNGRQTYWWSNEAPDQVSEDLCEIVV